MQTVDFGNYKIEKKKTLNYTVYQALKEMIIRGELPPDTKLSEVHIGNSLGVSATPVREAFRLLSADGLVEIIPYKGVYVKQYSLQEIKEVYQCREALEVMAVELAIDRIAPEELGEMASLMEQEKSNIDPETAMLVSNRLHDLIVDKSGNQRLKALLVSIEDLLMHDRNVSSFDAQRRLEIYNEHKALLEALAQKDKALAVERMRQHIQNGYRFIEEKMERK